jgi:hypothetical protein
MDQKELDVRFSYHAPTAKQIPKYDQVRIEVKELAEIINELCPESREKSLAFTHLEQVSFYANAGIARRSAKPTPKVE